MMMIAFLLMIKNSTYSNFILWYVLRMSYSMLISWSSTLH